MISRIRKALEERKDQGFTLIELLVVMIIIGILAAVAIPLFLSQREKAEDAAAKADVSTIGKEIATYFVDGTGMPAVIQTGTEYRVNGRTVGNSSPNVLLFTVEGTGSTDWCVEVRNANGSSSANGYSYSAANGFQEAPC